VSNEAAMIDGPYDCMDNLHSGNKGIIYTKNDDKFPSHLVPFPYYVPMPSCLQILRLQDGEIVCFSDFDSQ
jgi:hypothetical protein